MFLVTRRDGLLTVKFVLDVVTARLVGNSSRFVRPSVYPSENQKPDQIQQSDNLEKEQIVVWKTRKAYIPLRENRIRKTREPNPVLGGLGRYIWDGAHFGGDDIVDDEENTNTGGNFTCNRPNGRWGEGEKARWNVR